MKKKIYIDNIKANSTYIGKEYSYTSIGDKNYDKSNMSVDGLRRNEKKYYILEEE